MNVAFDFNINKSLVLLGISLEIAVYCAFVRCYGVFIDQLALKICDWLLLSVKVIAHARLSLLAARPTTVKGLL